MEGRGSDVEYWRGETHLGLSLPVSAHRFPYHSSGLVIAHVRASFPVSAHRFPCLCIVSCVRASFPVSAVEEQNFNTRTGDLVVYEKPE